MAQGLVVWSASAVPARHRCHSLTDRQYAVFGNRLGQAPPRGGRKLDLAMDACWARSLGQCSGKISGEHVISKSLFWSKKLQVQGYPWCPEPKTVGLASMVIKNLCTRHNSALSPLDSEAKRLLDAVLDLNRQVTACTSGERRPRRVVELDAARLERWMLKTSFNFLIQIGSNRDGLFERAEPDPALVAVAFGTAEFCEPFGLYWKVNTNTPIAGSDLGKMSWRSVCNAEGKALAIEMLFHGFTLWLALPGCPRFTDLNRGESIEHTEAGFEIRCVWSKHRIRERRRLAGQVMAPPTVQEAAGGGA